MSEDSGIDLVTFQDHPSQPRFHDTWTRLSCTPAVDSNALGAGAFLDAVEATGGPRRSPGEAVDASIEANKIIRGIWDADNAARFEVVGNPTRQQLTPR